MGIKVLIVLDHAHLAMEPGNTISMSKLHQITGHTGEHLLRPTANYKTEEHAKEENEEITNQTWIQGFHGHLFFQTSQQRRKWTLVDCGG